MTARLSLATLGSLPPEVARPAFDPSRISVGIVHLGLGAFHRAHQAVYTDDVLARDPRWGICGVSLKTPHATATLAAQEGLYTVLTKDEDGASARVIGALRETAFAGTDPDALARRIADPRVRALTLTVTEKGYCHDPATGRLNFDHPDIVHDLAHPATPVSAVGMVVAGLARRREARGGPLNVVCCDNLPHNGRVLEGLVRAYAERHNAELGAWIAQHAAFPCTMVDRIVPATTAADIDEVSRRLGVDDLAPVMTEPFNSWVIENRFVAPRPPWDEAGAVIVSDVAPFEEMKLRMLNGSHSTIAYLGFLMGHEFVWQASADPLLDELIGRQMAEEIAPTLAAPPGANPQAYAAQLLRRFRNPALPHRTQQIAMDGSQKLPQRLLGTVRDRIAAGASYAHLALAVAAWIRYASGRDEEGRAIAVSDPLASRFAAIAAWAAGDASRVAEGFLDLKPVFGELATHAQFRAKVRENVRRLFHDGARATVAAHLGRG